MSEKYQGEYEAGLATRKVKILIELPKPQPIVARVVLPAESENVSVSVG